MVLAGVVFSGRFDDPAEVGRALVTMVAFCLASSAVYVFNDWHDREEDRRHPTKWQRPIASGQISSVRAFALTVACAVAALGLAALVEWQVSAVIGLYLGMMAVYTLALRRLPIVDIVVIALGFLLRASAGAVAVDVPLSRWLFVCTLLLALTLAIGKRRHELSRLQGNTHLHRESLAGYARLDLDRWIVVTSALTLIAYAAYTVAVPSYGRSLPMILTLPFVAACLWRYLYLVLRKGLGGTPESLVLRDKWLFGGILAWAGVVAIVLLG